MEHQRLTDAFEVSDNEVERLYSEMHKTTEESKHLNCRSCGFNTCEQMVAAIILGIRHKNDCKQYVISEVEMQNESATSLLVEELLIMCCIVEKERKNVLASIEKFNAVLKMFDVSVDKLRKILLHIAE